MNPEIAQQPLRNRRLKLVVIVFVLLLIIFVIFLLMRPKAEFEQHRLVRSNLTASDNFGHLDGTDVYAYNGLAFYKIDLSNKNAVTVLHSGTKLPKPSNIYWAGSQGALLEFDHSFVLSKVWNELRSRGLTLNPSTQSYTWYLDFASGELKLVGEWAIRPGLAVFSEEANGFYYAPDFTEVVDVTEHQDILTDILTLSFYNIQSGQNENIPEDLDVLDISYLGNCPGQKICYIARDNENPRIQKLYGIDQDNRKVEVLDSGGRLFATNNSDMFVSVGLGDLPVSEEHEDGGEEHIEEDLEYPEEPARLHNIREEFEQDLGFDVGNSDVIVHIKQSGEFFAFDNLLVENPSEEDELRNYRVGRLDGGRFGKPQTDLSPLTYQDDKLFTSGILTSVSHGSAGESLVTSFDDDQLLFTTRQGLKELLPLNRESAQENVDKCMQGTARENQYFDEERLFKVFFADNASFAGNVKAFSDCLLGSDASRVAAFNFYFGALDPINGRITTD